MSDSNKNANRRYVGKVREQQGQYGAFSKVQIDNPTPTKLDKSTNTQVQDPYHKGMLLWLDHETGKKYLVKQLSVRGVSEAARNAGFLQSLSIDLDNSYEVQELS